MEGKPLNARNVVLVVEDEPFVRLYGADLLEQAGFDVLQAANADEALHLLETHPEVRVVFSDIEMPGFLDGLGLAHYICHRWPRIGIVLTSGHQIRMEMIPRDGRFMAKPYDGKALVRHIEAIMD
jgi:CheY-like chemotaxis protein